MKAIVLIGISPPKTWGQREHIMVARFSSLGAAWAYCSKSRIANPVKNCLHTPHLAKRVFSLKSLLFQYSHARVAMVEVDQFVDSLPIDPIIK